MTARIHLIERDGRLAPVQRGSQEYESGFWAIAEETASDLVKHLLGGSVTKAEVADAIRAASGK